MHKSSAEKMVELLAKYLVPDTDRRVLEVGSYLYGSKYPPGYPVGGYRHMIRPRVPQTTEGQPIYGAYTGLDIEPGPNVDIVAADPYHWPVEIGSYDLIVSGQCMEHVADLHAWMAEVYRCLTPGGLCIHIAPSAGPYHAFPVHCWLIMKDGMRYVLERAGFEILEVDQWDKYPFNDCWGVGRKPKE